MPLIKSAAPSAVSSNIREMVNSGHPQKQAVAASLHTADLARRAHMAGGGSLAAPSTPFSGDTFHPGGLFTGGSGGRTDTLPHAVAADSFVVPADVVSGLGQGDTLAGAKIMDGVLASGPFGTRLPHGRRASGGNTSPEGGLSHVMVAGGEYLVPRDRVAMLGNRMRRGGKSKARSDLAAGHEALRAMVDKVRKHQKKFLESAPKPKK